MLIAFLSTKQTLNDLIVKVLDDYGIVFATFVIGIIAGMLIKQYITDRRYYKSIEQRLKDKDEQIYDLKVLVSERFKKIEVEKHDKAFFNRILNYFKQIKK